MSIFTNSHQMTNGGGLILNLTATASNSGALPSYTTGVYLTATVPCFIEISNTATASANTGMYLASSATYWFATFGANVISGVQSSAAGTLYIKPTID